MAYLGNDLQVAFPTYRNIDDISGSFNGVTTSFPLTVGGVAPIPAPLNSQQCLISVNGVVQRPDDSGAEGFLLSGGNIVFASAPAGGVDFFGVILAGADYINIGANFPSGTALVPSITFDSDLDTGIYNPAGNQIGFTTAGVQRLVINSSGQVSGGLGSATTPAFSFLSDPNTGIYSPGADQVAVATNGTGRLFVDASGRVGIGTASPSFNLDVTGTFRSTGEGRFDNGINLKTATLNYIYFDDAISFTRNGTGERLRITSAGLVGIGTSSPATTLEANDANCIVKAKGTAGYGAFYAEGSTGSPAFYFFAVNGTETARLLSDSSNYLAFGTGSSGTERARIDSSGRLLVGTSSSRSLSGNVGTLQIEGTTNYQVAAVTTNTNDAYGSYVVLTKSRGTSLGSNAIVQNNDSLGGILFNGTDGANAQYAAQIQAYVDGTPGTNDMPGRLVFSTTADGASSPTERMRIDNGGAVSIGTTGAPGFTVFGVAFGRAGNTGMLEQSRNVSGSTAAAAFGGNAGVVYVMGDGDLENTNNRYTGISDIKFKQNIEDASSQWDDIKSIQVRKYELIANPDRKHIGCVAQELEQVCPGLVIEREDQEGEPYKSVAYSVLYMKAVKALQEAIGRIETLEGMVAVNNITIDEQQHQLSTLAARLTALESA